jgi:hypothetical protein
MRIRCTGCSQPIEGDPWWYDPLAHGMNNWSGEVAQLTGVVTQQPDPPSSVAGPFHKACLVKQLGREVDSLTSRKER